MLDVLNWYADHYIIGTIALILVGGLAANAARIVALTVRGK